MIGGPGRAAAGHGVALAWIAIAIASGPPRQRAAQVDSRIDEVRSEMRAGFAELWAQIDETNRILVGLANHRHDTDGTTVFTIPPAVAIRRRP